MDDEVRRLLTDFADRTVGEGGEGGDAVAPPVVDVDADVARGRRALRRLRLRRRTAGVFAVATVAGAVALSGGPGAWFSGDGDQVATDTPAASAASPASRTPAPPSARFSTASSVVLAKGARQWGGIDCGLSPAGWQYQKSNTGYAVLAPPYSSSSDARDLTGKLVLRTAVNADKILKVDAVRQPGRIVHLGWYPAGERVAQTKLGGTWLIVRTPRGAAGWDDKVLLEFVGSCSVTTVTFTTPPAR